jgi:hypothetical protein
MFPVMNTVKTLLRARKLTASNAPDENVSMKSSPSRILISLLSESAVATEFVLMSPFLP